MRHLKPTRWSILGVAALAVSMAGPPAKAASLLEKGKGDGLQVAYYNYNPFAYVNAEGKVVGEQVEILRYVLGKMGLKIAREISTEWGNLIPGLKAKRFDVIAASMYVTPKRCKEVAFTEPTFGIKQGMIVKKGNPKKLSNYESVRDTDSVLAAISGSAQVNWAKSVGIKESNIMQIPDTATGMAALRAGRADAFTTAAPGVRQVVAKSPENVEAVKPFGTVGGKYANPHGAYAVRKSETEFVVQFNKILKDFIGTPPHLEIMTTHNLHPSELPERTTAALCAG